jgi:hypothetical protein
MPDAIPSESEREPSAARPGDASAVPDEPTAAYVLGYADGQRLLKAPDASDASLQKVHARYGAHAEAAQPSPAEQAYLAGVRDAAADNLPSPPPEQRCAA